MAGSCLAAAPAAKSKAPSPPKPKYDLSFHPAVGQRMTYERSLDIRMTYHAVGNRNGVQNDGLYEAHRQLAAARDEVTEVRDGIVTGRRVTFGPKCWRMDRETGQQPNPVRLVYANKTVRFHLNNDETVDQDFGVKPTGEMLRLIKYTILGRDGWLPGKAVAVGERWRADEGLRPMLDLQRNDNVSAIATLKRFRTQDGRQVADVAVTGGAMGVWGGVNGEVSVEGKVVVDVQTGVLLKADLTGQIDCSAGMGGDISGAGSKVVSVTGTGKVEIHHLAHLLANRGENDDSDVPPLPPTPARVAGG
jgi:hypothetical protein